MSDNPNINIDRVAAVKVDATGVPVKVVSGSVTTSTNQSVTVASNEALLLSSLLFEIRMLRQAFQDWSGTNPRYDATQNPFSVQ